MKNTVVIGAQWGDEGKAKITDLLAQKADLIIRYQGGCNAGHTVVANGNTYKFHLIPSGILYDNTVCLIGSGTVIHPDSFEKEMNELKAQGLYEQTTFVFCSDHGQVDIDMSVNANKLLIENGLLTVDEEGNMTDWEAYVQSSAVSAHVYLKDPTNEALAEKVYRLLDENRDLLYIEHIFTREQVKKTYRLDGNFTFVLEAKEGSSFGFDIMADYQNPIMNDDYRVSRGTHGHIPSKGEQPCLILSGPGVLPGKELSVAKVVDIAPTCAAILGFDMSEADGRVLYEILED